VWFDAGVDLAKLISTRRRRQGLSLRVMEDRAREAGYPISRSQISNYEHSVVDRQPTEKIVRGLAAALDCSLPEVAAAVAETFGFDSTPAPERQRSQRAEAWLRLTGNRTDDEVTELLLIVEQILRMRDMDGP